MTWMFLALAAATAVGVIGHAFFRGTLKNPELVFVEMVKLSFHPFVVGFLLCAILATTINAVSSWILVLATSLTEDFYKRLFRKGADSRELLVVSRVGVVIAAVIALGIALNRTGTIYHLVLYAWSGIGASFAPLVLLCLYSKRINKYGAWAGILTGGIIAGVWPLFDLKVAPLIPGFLGGLIAILGVSHVKRKESL